MSRDGHASPRLLPWISCVVLFWEVCPRVIVPGVVSSPWVFYAPGVFSMLFPSVGILFPVRVSLRPELLIERVGCPVVVRVVPVQLLLCKRLLQLSLYMLGLFCDLGF